MDFMRRKSGFREPITAIAQTDITDKRASPVVRIIVSLTKVGQRGGGRRGGGGVRTGLVDASGRSQAIQ